MEEVSAALTEIYRAMVNTCLLNRGVVHSITGDAVIFSFNTAVANASHRNAAAQVLWSVIVEWKNRYDIFIRWKPFLLTLSSVVMFFLFYLNLVSVNVSNIN